MRIFHSTDYTRRVVPCWSDNEGYVVYTDNINTSGNQLLDNAEFIEATGGLCTPVTLDDIKEGRFSDVLEHEVRA